MGGEMRHLVGIREHGDARADVPETGHHMGESLPSISSAPCGPAPRRVHGSAPAGDGFGLQVDVNAVEPMKVMWASRKFIKKYGSVDTLEELLPNPQDFRHWLISIADAVWSGEQSGQTGDFGALVVGQDQRTQLRLVRALFVHPQELDRILTGAHDRSTYRVSIRLGGCLSGGSDSSSSSSRVSRGTSPSLERLSLSHQDRIHEGPANGAGEPSLPLELAQLEFSVTQGIVPI